MIMKSVGLSSESHRENATLPRLRICRCRTVWIYLSLICFCTTAYATSMKGGSAITNEQFPAFGAVQISQDALPEPCIGVIINSTTIATSHYCKCPCHLKGAFSSSGQPVNLKQAKSTSANTSVFEIELYTPEGGEFNAEYKPATLVVDKYDFLANLVTAPWITGAVLAADPPKVGAVVWNVTSCDDDYGKVKLPDWPATKDLPKGVFCISTGSEPTDVELNGVKAVNATPCDDSVGSPALLKDDGRVLGIVIKTFCGADNVAIAMGAYTLTPVSSDLPTLEPFTEPPPMSLPPTRAPTEPEPGPVNPRIPDGTPQTLTDTSKKLGYSRILSTIAVSITAFAQHTSCTI